MLSAATLGAVVALSPCPALSDPIHLQLWSGYEFSSGYYGEVQRTELQTVSISATARTGNWSLRLYVPWISLHGPSDVVVIGGSSGSGSTSGSGGTSGSSGDVGKTPGTTTPSPGPVEDALLNAEPPASSVRSGIGDTTAVLTYSWNNIADTRFYAVFGALLRIPTGSYGNGLGVGAVDEGLNTEIGRSFGNVGVYASLGYRHRGNHTGTQGRLDGWLTSLGGWYDATPDLQAGSYFYWTEKIAVGLNPQEAFGAYLRYKIDGSFSAQAYGETGFTASSPDIVAGIRLGYSL